MTTPDPVVRRRVPTLPDNPFPLGRHVVRDVRSRRFRFAVSDPTPVKSITWKVRIDVLQQGKIGSCTGETGTYGLATDSATRPGRTDARVAGSLTARQTLDQPYAYDLYSAATAVDAWLGTWPPDDTGSSGLAVAQVLRARGDVTMYQHCFTLQELLQALQHGAVMFGCLWRTAMFRPDERGRVRVEGDVAGGHQVLLVGVDVENEELIGVQSWGRWGAHADGTPRDDHDPLDMGGYFRISFTDARRLLEDEDGDAIVLQLADDHTPPGPRPTTAVSSWLERIVTFVGAALRRVFRRRH